MRLFVSLLLILSTHLALAETIQIKHETLGIEVTLVDSKIGNPVQSIKGLDGIEMSALVKGINDVIGSETVSCSDKGISGAINEWTGCDFIGFEPIAAKILPYKDFLAKYPHADLALVIKGRVHGQEVERTYFVPIQYLVEHHRKNESIRWWLTSGGVRSNKDYRFDRVDVRRIFND